MVWFCPGGSVAESPPLPSRPRPPAPVQLHRGGVCAVWEVGDLPGNAPPQEAGHREGGGEG